ncbi:unnamed protein product [Moneuplotes crassus]|uniref:Uncharacterized protein n=1 Tax=Euplotes crassus TaxID=5936 RepID=A0AAD2CWD7_EUPCR|nr:unnamed protein product [Moneuplotes crassus]
MALRTKKISLLRPSLVHKSCAFMSTEDTSDHKEQKTGKTDYEQRFGKNRKYEKPEFLKEDYDHLGADDFIEEDEFLPEFFSKDIPDYKRNPKNLNIPWLINGVPEMEIKQRFLGDQIFSRMKIHKGEVLEHLYKIFRATLLSAADRDYDFLKEYCEETFADKLIKRLENLRKEGLTCSYEEDMRPIEVEANMYDTTVIKGVNIHRKENGSEDDYIIHNDLEEMGFISYVPKYITKSESFTNPKTNEYMHTDAHRIIFRAYVCFKSGYKIHLKDSNGKSIFDYPEDYTWQHVGVFESEMIGPEKFNKWSLSENLMEWIAKHTFGTWKMVDLDNWLVGNPLVIPKFEIRSRTYDDIQSF